MRKVEAREHSLEEEYDRSELPPEADPRCDSMVFSGWELFCRTCKEVEGGESAACVGGRKGRKRETVPDKGAMRLYFLHSRPGCV